MMSAGRSWEERRSLLGGCFFAGHTPSSAAHAEGKKAEHPLHEDLHVGRTYALSKAGAIILS